MKLALFDLDHTLLNIDSDHSWGEFLIAEGLVDSVHYRQINDKFYADYKAGVLDPIAYNEFVFEFLTQHTDEELTALHQRFMQDVVAPQMRPEGAKTIQAHLSLGHTVVGITATSDFITTPIFHAFGIQHVIATQAEHVDGRYTGKVQGIPSYQAGKLIRLNEWLADQTVEESWAYSDSINDRALLEHATHPIAVNPDEELLKLAQEKLWRVADWSFV